MTFFRRLEDHSDRGGGKNNTDKNLIRISDAVDVTRGVEFSLYSCDKNRSKKQNGKSSRLNSKHSWNTRHVRGGK